MTDPSPLPPVPESLLVPLLQWTGEALRELKAQDVPPALRPMLGFDRRGFGSAAARAQLRRALDTDEDFRRLVFEALAGRDEVVAMLRGWDASQAVALAEEAAARDDLPLLASALVVARPAAWETGVGVVTAFHERSLEQRAVEDDRRAFETQVAKADEARRRAEEDLARARDEVERLAAELRDERASRRDREDAVRAEAGAAGRRVEGLEAAVARAQEEAARAAERAHREAERAEGLEAEVREARSEAARARAEAQRAAEQVRKEPPEPPEAPVPAVPEVVEEAPAPVLTRRVRVELPPGVIGPSLDGLRAALARSDPAVIVDGYNVSMLAWGDEPPDAQRQRLCAQLERLHLRTNRAVTVVFDGAEVEGVRPPRRPGVRVLFSAPGQEADDVVLREVASLPLERSAIVVSSDRRVQEGAEEEGALAVPSDVFLELLRK